MLSDASGLAHPQLVRFLKWLIVKKNKWKKKTFSGKNKWKKKKWKKWNKWQVKNKWKTSEKKKKTFKRTRLISFVAFENIYCGSRKRLRIRAQETHDDHWTQEHHYSIHLHIVIYIVTCVWVLSMFQEMYACVPRQYTPSSRIKVLRVCVNARNRWMTPPRDHYHA